jgi:tetratricopeptide (TPR) repeat protein
VTARVLALGLAAAVLFGSPVLGGRSLSAQGRFGAEETLLLREAATLESNGDLDGAEAALRHLIEIDPTSSGSIYALERVLRAKGDRLGLFPAVDGFLERREDAGIRALKLQLLVEADSLDALVAEADGWIARDPTDETAYTEVARAFGEAFGPDRALDVLVSGRAALGGDALALPMGDHFAARGDTGDAVDEWARAIGPDGSNTLTVRRRVEDLAEGETEAARRLVRRLGSSELEGRRRAGTQLAIELSLGPEALELARLEAESLRGAARTEYLDEISVAATAAGVSQVASWAYGELGRTEESPDARRLLEQRRVEALLAAGDTSAALDSFDRVITSMPAGSAERRLVEGRAIRIAAAAFEMDRLRAGWADFREVYPGAPEIDALAAATAAALVAWGDVEGAITILDGVVGPRSSLEKAYLILAGGDIEAGRGSLMQASGGLPPSDATEVIQLAGLLGRVSGQSAGALAVAGVQAHLGRGGAAALKLADEAFGLPVGDRAVLLAEAARMADRAGERAASADIRERLLAEYPDAPEAAEAALALARHRSRVERNAPDAIRILEDLITRQPNAAVVPEARLELERLRSR